MTDQQIHALAVSLGWPEECVRRIVGTQRALKNVLTCPRTKFGNTVWVYTDNEIEEAREALAQFGLKLEGE